MVFEKVDILKKNFLFHYFFKAIYKAEHGCFPGCSALSLVLHDLVVGKFWTSHLNTLIGLSPGLTAAMKGQDKSAQGVEALASSPGFTDRARDKALKGRKMKFTHMRQGYD